MAIKIYTDKAAEAQHERARIVFSGSFPLEAQIAEGMESMTLKEIAEKLQKQFEKKGAVGIELIEIRFAIIWK